MSVLCPATMRKTEQIKKANVMHKQTLEAEVRIEFKYYFNISNLLSFIVSFW